MKKEILLQIEMFDDGCMSAYELVKKIKQIIKNDNEREQQRKVLNNIFDIYGDVFVKNNNN